MLFWVIQVCISCLDLAVLERQVVDNLGFENTLRRCPRWACLSGFSLLFPGGGQLRLPERLCLRQA